MFYTEIREYRDLLKAKICDSYVVYWVHDL